MVFGKPAAYLYGANYKREQWFIEFIVKNVLRY